MCWNLNGQQTAKEKKTIQPYEWAEKVQLDREKYVTILWTVQNDSTQMSVETKSMIEIKWNFFFLKENFVQGYISDYVFSPMYSQDVLCSMITKQMSGKLKSVILCLFKPDRL